MERIRNRKWKDILFPPKPGQHSTVGGAIKGGAEEDQLRPVLRDEVGSVGEGAEASSGESTDRLRSLGAQTARAIVLGRHRPFINALVDNSGKGPSRADLIRAINGALDKLTDDELVNGVEETMLGQVPDRPIFETGFCVEERLLPRSNPQQLSIGDLVSIDSRGDTVRFRSGPGPLHGTVIAIFCNPDRVHIRRGA